MDWSTHTGLTNVYDQGNCGSCYAFAAADAVQTNHAILNQTRVFLSVEDIVEESTVSGNSKCDGGFPLNVFRFLKEYGVRYSKSSGGAYGRYSISRHKP